MSHNGICYHSCKFSGRLDSKRVVSKADCKIYLIPNNELHVMEIRAQERSIKEKLAHPLNYNHAFTFVVPKNLQFKKETPGNRIVARCDNIKKEYKFQFQNRAERDSVIEIFKQWGIPVGEKNITNKNVFMSMASESANEYVLEVMHPSQWKQTQIQLWLENVEDDAGNNLFKLYSDKFQILCMSKLLECNTEQDLQEYLVIDDSYHVTILFEEICRVKQYGNRILDRKRVIAKLKKHPIHPNLLSSIDLEREHLGDGECLKQPLIKRYKEIKQKNSNSHTEIVLGTSIPLHLIFFTLQNQVHMCIMIGIWFFEWTEHSLCVPSLTGPNQVIFTLNISKYVNKLVGIEEVFDNICFLVAKWNSYFQFSSSNLKFGVKESGDSFDFVQHLLQSVGVSDILSSPLVITCIETIKSSPKSIYGFFIKKFKNYFEIEEEDLSTHAKFDSFISTNLGRMDFQKRKQLELSEEYGLLIGLDRAFWIGFLQDNKSIKNTPIQSKIKCLCPFGEPYASRDLELAPIKTSF